MDFRGHRTFSVRIEKYQCIRQNDKCRKLAIAIGKVPFGGKQGQEMTSMEILRLLTFSGSFAILVSCLLGFAMLIPLQPWGRKAAQSFNFRQVRAAHLDWIMLGLMQGLAGALIWAYSLQPAAFLVWAMIFGSWVNPLSYLFRAFGINAFAFDGGALQRAAAALGGISSTALFLAWAGLIHLVWLNWE